MTSLGALSWNTVLQPNCEIYATYICRCILVICIQLYNSDRRTYVSVPLQEGWQVQLQWDYIQHCESTGRRLGRASGSPFPVQVRITCTQCVHGSSNFSRNPLVLRAEKIS